MVFDLSKSIQDLIEMAGSDKVICYAATPYTVGAGRSPNRFPGGINNIMELVHPIAENLHNIARMDKGVASYHLASPFYEIVYNIMLHAYDQNDREPFDITAHFGPGGGTFLFSDEGTPYDFHCTVSNVQRGLYFSRLPDRDRCAQGMKTLQQSELLITAPVGGNPLAVHIPHDVTSHLNSVSKNYANPQFGSCGIKFHKL